MKHYFFYSAILFCATLNNLKAQNFVSEPLLNKETPAMLRSIFYKYFSMPENQVKTDTMCIDNVTFMKFNISTDGKVENLEFNKSSNKTINDIFTNIMGKTEGQWTPSISDGKPIKSKPIVFPIIYRLVNGCGIGIKKLNRDGFRDALFDLSPHNTFIRYQLDCILLEAFCISPLE